MSLLAPTLQAFFTDRLLAQRQASPATITAYRDTFRLLLGFVCDRKHTNPVELDFADLDAPTVGAFLTHLETERGNSARTRNARLAAIHSLFRYAAFQHPEHAAQIARVLAIPQKRFDRGIVEFLTKTEVEAILAVPDRDTWIGRRDHALLTLAVQTGLRVAELTGLHRQDLVLTTGAHVRCHGKGRKQRSTPLTTNTVATLREWLRSLRCRTQRAAVSHPHRRTPEHRLRRMAPPQIHDGSRSAIPAAGRTNSHPARASPHRRDALTRSGRGHLDNRSLDGPRIHRLHPNLLARRPRPQTTRIGPHHPTGNHPGTLQTTRPPARLPPKSLNYAEPVTRQQPRHQAKHPPHRPHSG